jgi:glycosyltransferase involved in cell wall biosynthesis
VHLSNHLDPSRFDVRLGLLRKAGPFLADANPKRVLAPEWGERWFRYEGTNSSFYRPDRLIVGAGLAPLVFRNMVKRFRPHVAMSFLKGTSLITWAAMQGLGRDRPRWIVREGNNTLAVIEEETGNRGTRAVVSGLTRRAYHAADCLLANSEHMAEGLLTDLGLDPKRVAVINNPIDIERVRRGAIQPIERQPRPFIVNIGRLEYQKGHDLLLRAFAGSVAAATHDLVLIGRGTLEAELKRQAEALGIAERVRFLGFCGNPWAWVARADLFVLSSRWEGFPTAICEAMACGTPVLATDCRFGPRDLMRHGETGWLVPTEDAQALRSGMDRLLADPGLASELAINAKRRVADFGMEKMVGLYADLFERQAAAARI